MKKNSYFIKIPPIKDMKIIKKTWTGIVIGFNEIILNILRNLLIGSIKINNKLETEL